MTLTTLLRRSLLHRRSRSLSALTALTVSAAIATALLTLYASLDQKLHKEFRSFGANIVLTDPNLSANPNSDYLAQTTVGGGARVVPFAYAVATTDRGTPVVVVGTDLAAVRIMDPWWQVKSWPEQDSSGIDRGVLLGEKAAGFIADERHLKFTYGTNTLSIQPDVAVTHLQTGGEEDSRIYMDLAAFCALTITDVPPEGGQGAHCIRPTVLEIQIPGGTQAVEAALTRLHQAFQQPRSPPSAR